MICDPTGPCSNDREPLAPVWPEPGQVSLRRRLGSYGELIEDLVRRSEQRLLEGEIVGRRWDLEGDSQAMNLLQLWGYVAEGVTAYTELTAAEAYLGTASDWLDLARLADQVGYRPSQRVAAEGWVRFDTDRLASPLIPAGTKVQASGTPERDPQTFEVIADSQLDAQWADVTATWVPEPKAPTGRTVRFLGDPGFRAGDDVLLIKEPEPEPLLTGWLAFWRWFFGLLVPSAEEVEPVAVVTVVGHQSELGTTVVEFDRNLKGLLAGLGTAYAAYRILDSASSARRLSSVLSITETDEGVPVATPVELPEYRQANAITPTSVVLDRHIVELSADSLVAVVDWDRSDDDDDVVKLSNVVKVTSHIPIEWEVAPGTPVLASKLDFQPGLSTLNTTAGQRSVYVLDRRVEVTHYVFPTEMPTAAPGTGLQLRVWPAPSSTSPASGHLAVETTQDGVPGWELLEVTAASNTEVDPSTREKVGVILDLQRNAPTGQLHLSAASGNVVRVRHGVTKSSTLGSGDGVVPFRKLQVADDPIAAELAEDGSARNSLTLRVDDRRWTEHATLFDAGLVDGFETRVGPDGEIDVRFGSGTDGAIPARGLNNIGATYRVGGGTAGEVDSGEIDTLLGSLRGVRSVEGAGPTSNGADQPTESHLRRETPTRARAMDRIVSLGDVADLALASPGISHAQAWLGESPPGVSCGPGPTVAALRIGKSGVRAALTHELDQLSTYLDARRDVTIPLCVTSGEMIEVSVTLTVVADPIFEASVIEALVREALLDPDNDLSATNRKLGQPLDRSDVMRIVHSVEGVVGIEAMVLATATATADSTALGRLGAERHQLLVTASPSIHVVFS